MRNNQPLPQSVLNLSVLKSSTLVRIHVTFLLLPQKKSNQKKRGHSNMLPYAHAGPPPHLSEATAHATNNTCTSKC